VHQILSLSGGATNEEQIGNNKDHSFREGGDGGHRNSNIGYKASTKMISEKQVAKKNRVRWRGGGGLEISEPRSTSGPNSGSLKM
jgi:hypothetical protein